MKEFELLGTVNGDLRLLFNGLVAPPSHELQTYSRWNVRHVFPLPGPQNVFEVLLDFFLKFTSEFPVCDVEAIFISALTKNNNRQQFFKQLFDRIQNLS